MKDNQELKRQLEEKAQTGVEEVIWKLSAEQREYLEGKGHRCTPTLYCITTKKIWDTSKEKSSIIKEINQANRKGTRKLYRPLSHSQKRILDQCEVEYIGFKFKVRTIPEA